METSIPVNTDTVQVNKNLHFEQISDVCGISIEQIRSLNPQYKRDILPGNSTPCTLRLPHNYISTFIDSQDTIYTHRETELFTNRKTVSIKEEPEVISKPATKRARTTYHKIRKGETVSEIADKYGVSVRELKRWNRLRGNNISAGKRLKIRR
jgi:FOG: LysM repeat